MYNQWLSCVLVCLRVCLFVCLFACVCVFFCLFIYICVLRVCVFWFYVVVSWLVRCKNPCRKSNPHSAMPLSAAAWPPIAWQFPQSFVDQSPWPALWVGLCRVQMFQRDNAIETLYNLCGLLCSMHLMISTNLWRALCLFLPSQCFFDLHSSSGYPCSPRWQHGGAPSYIYKQPLEF